MSKDVLLSSGFVEVEAFVRWIGVLHACRFEHPQNIVLGQVISTNLELEALAGEVTPDMPAGAIGAEARLTRSLRLWLELQACVSGFIDSTAADKGVLVRSTHMMHLASARCCSLAGDIQL